MGEKTGISWCDHTFNPWIGCQKVSAGCKHCYAERDAKRYSWDDHWGPNSYRRLTSESNWRKPITWNNSAKRDDVRRKVFCASMGDIFEEKEYLMAWRHSLWALISICYNLDWLLLTKRPGNVHVMVPTIWTHGAWPRNVWLGTTAENQAMADKRIPILLSIPAKVRFVSVEPMLEPVSLWHATFAPKEPKHFIIPIEEMARFGSLKDKGISWVICGGESGPDARPMDLNWARELREECRVLSVPFFFKQVGGNKRIGGHWGGDLLDGKTYHEFPA